MKNKKLLVIIPTIIIVLLFILLSQHKSNYIISVEKIDDFSPDRKLIVYKNSNKIKFKELQYTDKTYLCSGVNPTVSYSEIMGVNELIIIIDNKKQIIAKIVEK